MYVLINVCIYIYMYLYIYIYTSISLCTTASTDLCVRPAAAEASRELGGRGGRGEHP